MIKRFAEDTKVPIARSRMEIDALLRAWGCDGLQWTDEWKDGRATLRFMWTKPRTTTGDPPMSYAARFRIDLPTDAELLARATPRGEARPRKAVYEALVKRRGMQEHRLLLLWLKAAFNAIEAGLIVAEQLFLPWLEARDGQTIGEYLTPRLSRLLTSDGVAGLLLEDQR